jgi:hypothetical protein
MGGRRGNVQRLVIAVQSSHSLMLQLRYVERLDDAGIVLQF